MLCWQTEMLLGVVFLSVCGRASACCFLSTSKCKEFYQRRTHTHTHTYLAHRHTELLSLSLLASFKTCPREKKPRGSLMNLPCFCIQLLKSHWFFGLMLKSSNRINILVPSGQLFVQDRNCICCIFLWIWYSWAIQKEMKSNCCQDKTIIRPKNFRWIAEKLLTNH